MSDDTTVKDAWADIQPGSPQISAGEAERAAEQMARLGAPADQVNATLKSMGLGPLDMSESAVAERTLDRMKNDPSWVARLNAGDAQANEEFNRLTLQMVTGAKSPERTLRPDEFSLTHHARMQGAPEADIAGWQTEFSQFASQIGLSKIEASAIAQIHLDGVTRYERMSEDERENFAHAQTAMLNGILAKQGDPEAQIKAATEALRRASGKDVDVARICRQVGAEQALELVIAAQRIARRSSVS